MRSTQPNPTFVTFLCVPILFDHFLSNKTLPWIGTLLQMTTRDCVHNWFLTGYPFTSVTATYGNWIPLPSDPDSLPSQGLDFASHAHFWCPILHRSRFNNRIHSSQFKQKGIYYRVWVYIVSECASEGSLVEDLLGTSYSSRPWSYSNGQGKRSPCGVTRLWRRGKPTEELENSWWGE